MRFDVHFFLSGIERMYPLPTSAGVLISGPQNEARQIYPPQASGFIEFLKESG